MTRRKQKKSEKRKPLIFRDERIRKLIACGWIQSASEIPPDAIPVDPDAVKAGYRYRQPVAFYQDMSFTCRDCGDRDLWRAADQQWYYEIVKASYDHTAVRCLVCRRAHRVGKAAPKRRQPPAG
ncbi:MAG: zinc-ribbon domain containing protein [Verrucomicrobiota bacterium]